MVVMLKPKTPTAAPKVADGIYPATLTKVTSFSNVYGQRIGFEFTLASGESLVLVVDGVRHGFASTNSNTAFIARKGFTSTLHKVPPEVLVDIANARQVKVRFHSHPLTLGRGV